MKMDSEGRRQTLASAGSCRSFHQLLVKAEIAPEDNDTHNSTAALLTSFLPHHTTSSKISNFCPNPASNRSTCVGTTCQFVLTLTKTSSSISSTTLKNNLSGNPATYLVHGANSVAEASLLLTLPSMPLKNASGVH